MREEYNMEISEKLRDFLLRNDVGKLFTDDDFESLYKKAAGISRSDPDRCFVAELTQVLYAAKIDPLQYMDYIPGEFLRASDIKRFIIPDHIKRIGKSAFHACDALKDVDIPGSVKSIGSSAFSLCESLTSINIPDSAVSIGRYALYNCGGLTEVIIPDSVTSIGDGALWGCDKLIGVTIGSGITRIPYSILAECTKLRKINYNGIMDQWKKIGTRGSRDIRDCTITCIDGTLEWDDEIKGWMET